MRAYTTLVALLVVAAPAYSQDANVTQPVPELEKMLATEPFRIVSAEISRPKAKGDITLKADVAFGDREPIRVKLRKAVPGAEEFNNNPRYDMAAYEIQKLLMDPPEYVVPPTALRMIPADDLRKFAEASPTFKGSDDVLAVLQYWLHDIKVVEDVYDPALFQSDPVYARHIGQLNVFTFLINHRDSNAGNFLISANGPGQRVFSVDNGLAFASPDGDRGELWKPIRVDRLPADTIARLRQVTKEQLTEQLGVVAQFQLQNGRYVAVPLGANLGVFHGVRTDKDVVQLGLTSAEIADIWRKAQRLLDRVDKGDIKTF